MHCFACLQNKKKDDVLPLDSRVVDQTSGLLGQGRKKMVTHLHAKKILYQLKFEEQAEKDCPGNIFYEYNCPGNIFAE